jgi:hypothetical protein
MATVEERLKALEIQIARSEVSGLRAEAARVNENLSYIRSLQTTAEILNAQGIELSIAVAVTLRELASQAKVDLNGLILALEQHLEARMKSNPQVPLEHAELLVATLRSSKG